MLAWLPLAIELVKEWVKEGEPSKANVKVTVEAILSSIKNANTDDIQKLGSDLKIIGNALEAIAINHAPPCATMTQLPE